MKDNIKTLVKFGVCLVLLLIAYLPTLAWMVNRWFETESYYGHGILIPIVSAYLLWQRRGVLKKIKIYSNRLGMAIVAAGLFIHIISAALKVYFISGFSLVFVLYGLVIYIFGKEMARNIMFPILFLLAMVPLPLTMISTITVKMKLFAAQISTVILNHIGFPSIRDGSIIRMPNSFIAVEAPCSGLRSLISLMTLGLIFSYALKASYTKKTILFLSAIPIALISNISRIILIAVVNDLYGEKVAMGLFHDMTGFLVFAIAFAGLFWVSQILETK